MSQNCTTGHLLDKNLLAFMHWEALLLRHSHSTTVAPWAEGENLCAQVPLVAYVGRLAGQKGMDVMLSALPALLGQPPRPLAGDTNPSLQPALLHCQVAVQQWPCIDVLTTTPARISKGGCWFAVQRLMSMWVLLGCAEPAPAASRAAAVPSGLQVAVLGTGEGWMERAIDSLSAAFPGTPSQHCLASPPTAAKQRCSSFLLNSL